MGTRHELSSIASDCNGEQCFVVNLGVTYPKITGIKLRYETGGESLTYPSMRALATEYRRMLLSDKGVIPGYERSALVQRLDTWLSQPDERVE